MTVSIPSRDGGLTSMAEWARWSCRWTRTGCASGRRSSTLRATRATAPIRSRLAGRGSTAHGFDTIVDETNFAGGAFSFFDQEGIRLIGTGVALTNPGSLLVSLRSNKEEGQANFVNPGIYIFNAGADFNVTPKLKAFVNGNYLRFDRTEPLRIPSVSARHSAWHRFGHGRRNTVPAAVDREYRDHVGSIEFSSGGGVQGDFERTGVSLRVHEYQAGFLSKLCGFLFGKDFRDLDSRDHYFRDNDWGNCYC
jgi:hypothetical protein